MSDSGISLRSSRFSEFTINGRTVLRDEFGYLADPDDWDKAIAETIATEEGVALGDDHWEIISFIRDSQEERGISPDARFVFSFIAERRGVSKRKARDIFFELFPYGYVKQACKIAGMRQPRAWSTG